MKMKMMERKPPVKLFKMGMSFWLNMIDKMTNNNGPTPRCANRRYFLGLIFIPATLCPPTTKIVVAMRC